MRRVLRGYYRSFIRPDGICCLWVFFLTLCLLLLGCDNGKEKKAPVVRLDKLKALAAARPETSSIPFRVAVAAIVSPEGTVESYRPLLAYLGEKLNRKTQLIQRRTYWEVNDMIAKNRVDLAFICTGAYIQQEKMHAMSILVVPEIDGKVTYNAVIIVSAKSNIQSFEDLRGKVFAFTDPLSNTGYLYPLHLLTERCSTPDEFFHKTIFTYSHDRSIMAVVDGVADGASVDNIVYKNALRKDPRLKEKLKVIMKSEDFGMPPVVVPSNISSIKRKRLESIFLHMHEDPKGRAALKHLGIDRFVRPTMELYSAPCLKYKDQPCSK